MQFHIVLTLKNILVSNPNGIIVMLFAYSMNVLVDVVPKTRCRTVVTMTSLFVRKQKGTLRNTLHTLLSGSVLQKKKIYSTARLYLRLHFFCFALAHTRTKLHTYARTQCVCAIFFARNPFERAHTRERFSMYVLAIMLSLIRVFNTFLECPMSCRNE